MDYVYVIINEDAAHDCIRDVGKLGCLQFQDLNEHLTPFQRRYVSGVKRCDELERKIRFFTAEIEKFKLPIRSAGGASGFLEQSLGGRSSGAILSDLELELEDYEKQVRGKLSGVHWLLRVLLCVWEVKEALGYRPKRLSSSKLPAPSSCSS